MVDSSELMDNLYRALADRNRRRLLCTLLKHNAREGVSILDDVPVGKRDHESLHLEMVHCHLPMLEDMGFIEWDRQAHQLVKGPDFKTIQPVLETLQGYHETNSANT